MKLLKILIIVFRNPIKTSALFTLLMLSSNLSGQDNTWRYYKYSKPVVGDMKLDGDTLWIGSSINLIKLNTVTLMKEDFYPDVAPGSTRSLGIDKQKNIWMGSAYAGVLKFNGKSWTVYNKKNSGLPDDDVEAVAIDKQGNVWTGTAKGLAKFDGGVWETYSLSSADTSIHTINELCVDNFNNVWASGFGKLHKFDGTSWKTFDVPKWEWPSDQIVSMISDSTGKLWIATSLTVYSFDGSNWEKLRSGGMNYSITFDLKGNILLSSDNDLNTYDPKISIWQEFRHEGSNVAVADPKGGIWVNREYKEPDFASLRRIRENFHDDYVSISPTIPDYNVKDFVLDPRGYAWIATQSGLARFDGKRWTNWQYVKTDSTIKRLGTLTALAVGLQGEIWAGNDYTGLYFFDGITWKNFNKSNSGMTSNQVRAAAVDHEGNVWVGTYGGGLLKYDGVNWVQYCPYNDIYSITVDSKGIVWVGTDGGLTKFEGNNSVNFNTSNALLPGNFIYSLAVDQKDNIWFVSSTGRNYFAGYLMKFDGQNFSRYEVPGISNNDLMTSVAIDEKGVIWAGHVADGIYKYDGNNWTQLNTSNSGLQYGDIGKILIDKYGNKWIAYRYGGLSVYNENGILSEVKGETVSAPKEFSLTQNYPNPFNPTTNISYSIPEAQNVKLTIYNMLGREVSTLVNEYKSAGTYRVSINASYLPSGVYIYTIQAGKFRDSKKLVLLK